MTKLLSVIFLIALCNKMYSQADTLYTKSHKKIPCKIVEIGETEIKYKNIKNLDGPVYVINASTIYKYTMANGFTEVLTVDELSVETQYADIRHSKSVIKVQPFSFVNNHLAVAYEYVIKVGTNLDVELGYINNSITESTANNGFHTQSGQVAPCTGVYLKPGVKFLVGQDFTLKGLKYAHPLKGRYIKLDLALSYMNIQDATTTTYNSSYNQNTFSYTYNYSSQTSDINTFSYGGFVNYGRQFILGSVLTVDYYIGIGVTGQTYSQSNITTKTGSGSGYGGSYNYYGQNDAKNISNYHGFFRTPGLGLSYTAGFRIGYIIPEKKQPYHSKYSSQD